MPDGYQGYCTVVDVRQEGVTEKMASEDRLVSLIDEASRSIEAITGWFFEPRTMTLQLSGRAAPSIELPVPPIELHQIQVNGAVFEPNAENLVVCGAPVGPGFDAPRITLRYGRFPKGQGNVLATGVWGYTEADGTPAGRTPLEIRRACLLLVMRWLYPLADDASRDVRFQWRLIEERTRDQSFKLDPVGAQSPLTGDPEIDSILFCFKRPAPLGAA